MGQQQLLLIIAGVIILGIAIAVGLTLFGGNSTQANKDGIMSGLMNIAANAYQYKFRPTTMGGGSNSYIGYTVPNKMSVDENGTYSLGTVSSNSLQLLGTSVMNSAWIATCTADDSGKTTITFSGW